MQEQYTVFFLYMDSSSLSMISFFYLRGFDWWCSYVNRGNPYQLYWMCFIEAYWFDVFFSAIVNQLSLIIVVLPLYLNNFSSTILVCKVFSCSLIKFVLATNYDNLWCVKYFYLYFYTRHSWAKPGAAPKITLSIQQLIK